MRWDTFARSLGFAVVAALAWVAWAAVAGPIVGGGTALRVYAVVATTVYVGGLGGAGPRRLVATLLAGAVGVGLALLARTPAELAIGLGAILGTARSGLLHRAPPVRAVVTEVALLGFGLLFAAFLGGRSLLAVGLGVWGFLLVQSCYFLVGGRRREARGSRADAFDEAYGRAMAVLEGRGV